MQDQPFDREALHAILEFYSETGVDIALDEAPHDRFAEAPPPARILDAPSETTRPKSLPPALPTLPALGAEAAASLARDQAGSAASLDALEEILRRFDGCALKFSAKNLVFSDGNPQSRVMLVGEAPGGDEDRIGKPFVGRAGQLLDRMLAAIGLDRTEVYIANIVPWRPPGNRTPTPQETAICKPFIARQIELANPEILVCLGGPSMQNLLDTKEGILRARGRWASYRTGDGREIRTLPTLHPAYLLRQPLQKRLGWRDFQALRRALDGRE